MESRRGGQTVRRRIWQSLTKRVDQRKFAPLGKHTFNSTLRQNLALWVSDLPPQDCPNAEWSVYREAASI
jgi:hypothetical protein